MRFENQFEVPGSPALVIEKFEDVPLMASFLPGASAGPANPDGSYPASLLVSFGPKRLTFKGRLTNQVDRQALSGVLSGTASADVRGAKLAVTMRYGLSECGPSRTRVSLVSEAQLAGILAEFASTGGVVVTNALLAEFSRRFSAHFAAEEQAVPVDAALPATATAAAAPAAASAPEALSAGALALAILKNIPRSLVRAARRLLGLRPTRRD